VRRIEPALIEEPDSQRLGANNGLVMWAAERRHDVIGR
jgi:hypothetical protein